MIEVFFAFLAGVVTVGAPCILPMLPILLATTVGRESRTRPLFITIGFVLAFSAFAFLFGLFTHIAGLSPQTLRTLAVVLLALFGIFMIWPLPFEKLSQYFSRFITGATQISQAAGNGNLGAFVLGLLLGVIWTPCAGPVLGTILTLIATKQELGQAAILLIAYALGAGLPMLLIGYGGQAVTTRVRFLARYATRIQQGFGVLILLLALAIHFQYDTVLQAKLLQYLPTPNIELPGEKNSTETPAPALVIRNYGPAPEITGIETWLNGSPQDLASLRGKVVLIDFWTYSCINCIRTLPYVASWYETYKDKGFTVIGVHTPEFAFEKDKNNVQRALKRFNIPYPVALDNNYATWKAYHNEAWPAHYLIDQNGLLVYMNFGEGEEEKTERAIRTLLGLASEGSQAYSTPNFRAIRTPEIYFGMDRLQYLASPETAALGTQTYSFPENLPENRFALDGSWNITPESAQLQNGKGRIRLRFSASKVYGVMQSEKPVSVRVWVDGVQTKTLLISNSELYPLFESDEYRAHTLDLEIPEGGLEMFTFTFG